MARWIFRPAIILELLIGLSGWFNHSPRADTTGTNPCFSYPTRVGNHAHPLEVGEPASSCLVMGVGNVVPGNGTFSANLTYLGHFLLLISLSQTRGTYRAGANILPTDHINVPEHGHLLFFRSGFKNFIQQLNANHSNCSPGVPY